MKRVSKFLLLITVAVLGSTNYSFKEDASVKYWSETALLEWEDFKGYPEEAFSSYDALTSSGIIHYTGCKNDKISYKIQAYFEKNESWARTHAKTPKTLAHEQLHFDITELFVRKLKRELSLQVFNCEEGERFEAFIRAFQISWNTKQRMYDIKTRHSLNDEEQAKWHSKIKKELKELEAFK